MTRAFRLPTVAMIHFFMGGYHTETSWKLHKSLEYIFTELNGKLQPERNQAPLPRFHGRNRAEFLTYATSTAVKQRLLDVSTLSILAAEDISWNVKHEQRYTEVLETVRDIETLWSHEPAVKQLREKISTRQA